MRSAIAAGSAGRLGRGLRCAAATLVAPLIGLASASPALARDAVVTSFDGTPISTHFFPAAGPHAGEPAPTVLVGSGFPYPGGTSGADAQSDTVGPATLRGAGFNVVSWDPRGVGASGGDVHFDSPDYEARDVEALVDYVATQPDALLDGPGDPRVGMSGPSYSGAIQLLSAALDPRIDAIVPDVTWNSLVTSLFRDGDVKAGFYTVCATGEVYGTLGGVFGAAGIQLGGLDGSVTRACVESLAGGRLSSSSTQWAADRGPGELLQQIHAPTLIESGTVDALFAPGQGAANYDVLRHNDVPVKMLWYCGGHGTCPNDATDSRVRRTRAALTWLQRWLQRDASIDTGPRFEWVDDDGAWHSGPDYPLASKGTVDTRGSGSMIVSPVDSAGVGSTDFLTPLPATNAVNVPFPSPAPDSDLVGEPTVRITYHGTAIPAQTFLYAQIVDGDSGRVVGHQVTPIPVTLDGRARTVQRSLEVIAASSPANAAYRLQVTPGTSVYAPQRAVGRVVLDDVAATLPIVDPTRSGRPGSPRATPPRLRVHVSSRRVGRVARVVVSGRLLASPCSGSVLFSVRAGHKVVRRRANVRASCVASKVIRIRVAARRRVVIGARFDGNAALAPRRARSLTYRVH